MLRPTRSFGISASSHIRRPKKGNSHRLSGCDDESERIRLCHGSCDTRVRSGGCGDDWVPGIAGEGRGAEGGHDVTAVFTEGVDVVVDSLDFHSAKAESPRVLLAPVL